MKRQKPSGAQYEQKKNEDDDKRAKEKGMQFTLLIL